MKIISWNIRGARKKTANDYLWSLVRRFNVEVILLLETHLVEEEAENYLKWRKRVWDGEAVYSNGRSGGMILLWKKDAIKGKVVFKDSQSINCIFEKDCGKCFLFTGIYASTNIKMRGCLCKRFSELQVPEIPWLITGDMNCITKAEENKGRRAFVENTSLADFRNLVDGMGLFEADHKGPHFTWSNKRVGGEKVLARLDRTYYNAAWLDWDLNIMVEHMNMVDSSHRPVMIKMCKWYQKQKTKNKERIYV
ncbi:hypothetical protein Cni_G01897 [Canna indica]|uniref:Endonuclease/exonuclease/phosphatase domain-containing protein n=1 Tax=Canna indica TaxID=4628 RepID=A0AAQ3PZB3_9LILI|nr:hypothetical protein Cni_G01897 [Canna indica]